ncbi:MAG: hypothetical protein GY788_21220 [bacterium]|nr:hypothetical protein [bacterium]
MYAHLDPTDAPLPHKLPNVELVEHEQCPLCGSVNGQDYDTRPICDACEPEDGWYDSPGWYYAFGFPGCLNDSDPCGPHYTAAEALAEARNAHDIPPVVTLSYTDDVYLEDSDGGVADWDTDTDDAGDWPANAAQNCVLYTDAADAYREDTIDGSSLDALDGDETGEHYTILWCDGGLADRLRSEGWVVIEDPRNYPISRQETS